MLYGLDDITIIPSVVTYIEHRGDCSVNYQKTGMLPLFTAPMASVINDKNWELYANQQINTIIPRTIGYDTRLKLCDKTFVAMGLDELDEFVKESELKGTVKICLDIANGHMKKAIDLCSKAKEKFGDKLILMAGNIANPETYREYARAGVDYIRISVGSGSCCITSSNSGCYTPMASLIVKCSEIKKDVEYYKEQLLIYKSIPKIVADGGFKNFDQIIKALALGADYVMLGSIFAKSQESLVGDNVSKKKYIHKKVVEREHFGMSTKKAQLIMGKSKDQLKTSEGISIMLPVEYKLATWVDNFKHYLREAMSLTNIKNIEDFIGRPVIEHITPSAYFSYYK